MKPFYRLPVSVAALAALFLLGAGPSQAADDEPGRRAAAEGLLNAMHTSQMVNGNLTRILGDVDKFGESLGQQATLTPEQTETVKKAQTEARDTITKEMGYDALKGEFVNGYAEAFSEGELKELTAFYNSPIGQKLLEKQPPVTDKVGKAAQAKMRTVITTVGQKFREVAQKVLPPPPTPETVVPAPGAPPVPPAPPAPGAPPVPPAPPTAAVPPMPMAPPTTPVPVTTPMPPTAPMPATAVTPPVTSAPVPVMPTPLPSVAPATTPSAQ